MRFGACCAADSGAGVHRLSVTKMRRISALDGCCRCLATWGYSDTTVRINLKKPGIRASIKEVYPSDCEPNVPSGRDTIIPLRHMLFSHLLFFS
jgi:uncharacterized metal-binding protein